MLHLLLAQVTGAINTDRIRVISIYLKVRYYLTVNSKTVAHCTILANGIFMISVQHKCN